MSAGFIIYALPRSRTWWLSRFLTYADWTCGHDELRHARSMDDIPAWFGQPCTGTVETAAAPWWRLVPPEMRTVVVRRPVAEVVDSLFGAGLQCDRDRLTKEMVRLGRKLDQIERRVAGVLSVRFDDLASEETCARVFEHCLPYPHDHVWWTTLSPVNLQTNLLALMRYMHAYQAPLAKLAAMAKQRTLAQMTPPPREPDGVTIQQEPFEALFQDGRALFAEHSLQVGEAPDSYLSKNIPLMRVLEEIGAMQITTARSNGRMFGYLMAIISPSLESPEVTTGVHTLFFADRAFPGLGMKLQRASIAALRARGVDEIVLRAGPRGSGPKMGALYRRLGAVDHGQLFILDGKTA